MPEPDRFQPEFSPGERLAALEATVQSLAHLKEAFAALEAAVKGHWSQDVERQRLQQREHDKFEASVSERFRLAAEALDVAVKAADAGVEKARTAAKEVTDAHASQLAELRSSLDKGPPELRQLASRSDQSLGAEARTQQITARMFALAAVGATLLATLVSALVVVLTK